MAMTILDKSDQNGWKCNFSASKAMLFQYKVHFFLKKIVFFCSVFIDENQTSKNMFIPPQLCKSFN